MEQNRGSRLYEHYRFSPERVLPCHKMKSLKLILLLIILSLLLFSFSNWINSKKINNLTENTCTPQDSLWSAVDSLLFKQYVQLLEKVDRCDTTIYTPAYTPHNTHFYELGKTDRGKILLTITGHSCGHTGSCGDRILVFKESGDILLETCGFLDHVSDTITHGICTFFTQSRGYQTGPAKWKTWWTGEAFKTKAISRNNIPWSILEQLPLEQECGSLYDCYMLDHLNMRDMDMDKKGTKAVLVTLPAFYLKADKSKDGQSYWLFTTQNKEDYQWLRELNNVWTIAFDEDTTNEYYDILIKEYEVAEDSPYYFFKKKYVWNGAQYKEVLLKKVSFLDAVKEEE